MLAVVHAPLWDKSPLLQPVWQTQSHTCRRELHDIVASYALYTVDDVLGGILSLENKYHYYDRENLTDSANFLFNSIECVAASATIVAQCRRIAGHSSGRTVVMPDRSICRQLCPSATSINNYGTFASIIWDKNQS